MHYAFEVTCPTLISRWARSRCKLGWSRLVRMQTVKVRNELRIHNEPSRHPGTLLRTLPLIHKILHPTSTAARAKEAPDRVHRTAINELRRRGRQHGRNQRTLLDWLDPGDMERRVDPQGPGKPKTYRLWVDDVSDGEGPNKLGSQLEVLHL